MGIAKEVSNQEGRHGTDTSCRVAEQYLVQQLQDKITELEASRH